MPETPVNKDSDSTPGEHKIGASERTGLATPAVNLSRAKQPDKLQLGRGVLSPFYPRHYLRALLWAEYVGQSSKPNVRNALAEPERQLTHADE